MKRILSAVAVLAAAFVFVPAAQKQSPNPDLCRVQKIFIGEMGKSDEAARFRLLLTQTLSDSGFTVVDAEDKADSILSGALSVRVFENNAKARATVQLKSHEGGLLWSGNFTPHRIVFTSKDEVQRRAEEIAKALRSDWEKSAKKAGTAADRS
jgi:hypothetical protein